MVTTKTRLFSEDKATAILAKALVFHALRSPLEDHHAGIFPCSKSGDYSDVKVVTPYGDIPWSEVSRISDEEMKLLMIEATSMLYTLIAGLDNRFNQAAICTSAIDTFWMWDDPLIVAGVMDALCHPISLTNTEDFIMISKIIASCDVVRQEAT